VAICIFWGAYYRAIGDDGFVDFGPPIAGSRGAAPEKNSEFKLKSNHVRLTITLTITLFYVEYLSSIVLQMICYT
jgi:hypothetical protein